VKRNAHHPFLFLEDIMGGVFFLAFAVMLCIPVLIIRFIKPKISNRHLKKLIEFISILFLAIPVSWIIAIIYGLLSLIPALSFLNNIYIFLLLQIYSVLQFTYAENLLNP
jgi:ABC-type antimicrobial peptide transport system permease subunit